MPKGIFQSDQPLWLPKGSIRAIIALALVLVWLFLEASGVVVSRQFYVLLGAVVAWYFSSRENNHNREAEKERLEELRAWVDAVTVEDKRGGGSAV